MTAKSQFLKQKAFVKVKYWRNVIFGHVGLTLVSTLTCFKTYVSSEKSLLTRPWISNASLSSLSSTWSSFFVTYIVMHNQVRLNTIAAITSTKWYKVINSQKNTFSISWFVNFCRIGYAFFQKMTRYPRQLQTFASHEMVVLCDLRIVLYFP